nr:uncharacterized mitochondrial protein AtMg00810-like [Tanacetum cinerariifolium]
MMGEMTFFLGLQVNQSPSGIFINQSKYMHEILMKYGLNTSDIAGTPMDIKDKLDLDQIGTPVDATKYRSMIGALMYLTSSKSDIVHATCVCARYQAHPTEKHLKEVKRIYRYLRGTVNMGLWYTKDSGFELTRFLDADYAGCKDTFKSTSGEAQFLGKKLMSWSSKKQDCTSLSTMESEYPYPVTEFNPLERKHSSPIPFHQGARRKGEDGNPARANIKQALGSDDGNPSRANIKQALGIRSSLRTDGAAAKPCQGDSLEFYLITGTSKVCLIAFNLLKGAFNLSTPMVKNEGGRTLQKLALGSATKADWVRNITYSRMQSVNMTVECL